MSINEDISNMLEKKLEDVHKKWSEVIESQIPNIFEFLKKEEIHTKTKEILLALSNVIKVNSENTDTNEYNYLKKTLKELSRELTIRNVTPTETALIIFYLKDVIFASLDNFIADNSEKRIDSVIYINRIIDKLGLFTFEVYSSTRESIIKEQARAILEMSTPVVKIWNKIILLPLVGVLDSSRAKQMMESLLSTIENNQAKVAIIDISGIPVIDTLVARHLFTTIAAVKLMGSECIVTGISAKISQTIVHLGLDLSGITTRASLADGLHLALSITSQKIS